MSTNISPGNTDGQRLGFPPVALIAGPTASGKSDVAVKLAQSLRDRGKRAVILNADSAQVYADLRVLSARPSDEEMGGIEHRLYGAWDGKTPCSAADWAQAAKTEISALHEDSAIPILCGGTGLYMRALLDGIAPIPEIDHAIRSDIRALPQKKARAALEKEDPVAAARLAPADAQRTCRALEVIRSTGRPLDEWHQHLEGGIGDRIALAPLRLLPPRDWLFERCDLRFELMMDGGAVEEVQALMTRRLDPALPVMRAIGVREIASWLKGELTREEAMMAGQLATRQYAKRQYTWFRNQPPENWPAMEFINANLNDIFDILFQ